MVDRTLNSSENFPMSPERSKTPNVKAAETELAEFSGRRIVRHDAKIDGAIAQSSNQRSEDGC